MPLDLGGNNGTSNPMRKKRIRMHNCIEKGRRNETSQVLRQFRRRARILEEVFIALVRKRVKTIYRRRCSTSYRAAIAFRLVLS
jgi:5-methylcytosine-specific restriction endonuclease McrBC regulatory subunit McrC